MSTTRLDARAGISAALLVLVLAASACGSSTKTEAPASGPGSSSTATALSTPTSAAVAPVVKDILDTDTAPPGAPGRTLTLIRYTIAPGAKLAPHIHPGVQMASITQGTLTYTVVSGTARVRRAGTTTQTPVTGRQTIQLARGDAVIEVAGMVHFGENKAKEPVVITATLLTEHGHPLSEPVTLP